MSEIDAPAIERSFSATTPGRNLALGGYAAIGLLTSLLLLASFSDTDPLLPWGLAFALPWFLLACLVALGWRTTKRQRRQRQAIATAWQHVQLEEWQAARDVLTEVSSAPIRAGTDRCAVFLLLAAVVEHENQHELAAQIYQKLLLERIGEGHQLQQAQLALISAKLHNEELTDALRMLDRLEHVPMPLPLRAAYSLTRLHQQVFMGHFEDAVEKVADKRSLFRRYLSTRAALGYGLFAFAMHSLGRKEEASQLWLDATMLMSSKKLIAEYGMLGTVRDTYPAGERPR